MSAIDDIMAEADARYAAALAATTADERTATVGALATYLIDHYPMMRAQLAELRSAREAWAQMKRDNAVLANMVAIADSAVLARLVVDAARGRRLYHRHKDEDIVR